jgi:hypothetical protein
MIGWPVAVNRRTIMKSIAEQQQEYLARPDVRTMPLSEAELKEAEDFDVDWQAGRITGAPPIISPNPELLIKFFMLGNYIVCREGFISGIQTLRPIFSQVPGPVEEAKSSWTPDNEYLRTHGLQPVEQRHAVTVENEKQAESASDRMHKLAKEGARKLDFQSRMFGIEKVRMNSSMPGLISWSATHRERIRQYEALRPDFPEFVKYIDQAIAKEKAA